MKRALAVCTATFLLLLAAGQLPAHEGHDHDDRSAPPARTVPRGEAASDAFELVAVSEGNALAIYLDRFASNEPIGQAIIEVETPAGPVTASVQPGNVYRISAPWLAKAGKYDLIFTVTAGGTVDVLPVTLDVPQSESPSATAGGAQDGRVGQIVLLTGAAAGGVFLAIAFMTRLRRRRRGAAAVILLAAVVLLAPPVRAHEGEDHGAASGPAQAGGSDLAQRLPDGSLFVPKATQRILAIRTAMTANGRFQRTIELPGRIIPDPNASGLVQAATGGRLAPPPGGFPRLGTRVAAGDVLAYVTPPLQAIDLSDLRQRQGELDQQISIVERRVTRFEPLAQSGAVSRVQLDEARLELQGLKDRRAALDKSRREPESLIAPVAGLIAEGTPVAGQMAQPNTVVFHIIDPARLWIEALSFEALAGTRTATARTGSGQNLILSYRGTGFAGRNQSIPVHFAVEGDANGLRVGQFVTVFAGIDEEQQGIAVPRASVVRSANGQDLVYEHVTAERFQPRPVRIEPLDGEQVLVAAGIASGKRIAVQGAELLNQIR
jgi:cobalt-zinc-cadmium efflux system membrane fusion protein